MRRFIDLFCGIGGFRVALENLGLECVFSSDIDKRAQESYGRNFGERPVGDISLINERSVPKHDVLCAGFPCQSFSISGKQKGINDPRGKLFYEIIRIASYHKPKILLLENVKNILSIDNGNAIRAIETELDKIGYFLRKDSLNASFFGVPQSRERVYFVGILKKYANEITYSPPKATMQRIFLEDIMDTDPDPSLFINRSDIKLEKLDIIQNSLKPIRVGVVNKGGQGERIYSVKGHAITLSAYGGGVGAKTGLYKTAQGIRRLSIDECKHVMGFPKKHIVSDGIQGYKQLGNAVIPKMISHIWEGIKHA